MALKGFVRRSQSTYAKPRQFTSSHPSLFAAFDATKDSYTLDLLVGMTPMQGHITIGMEKVLKMGFRGIALQAERRLEEFRNPFLKTRKSSRKLRTS